MTREERETAISCLKWFKEYNEEDYCGGDRIKGENGNWYYYVSEEDFRVFDMIIEALSTEESEDCITLRLKKGTLKYSDKDYVVYKKEWLKKWWQPELALLGIQPKEIYNKGWKDGAEATAYHVELCEKESPTIPMAVIEDIKAEIVKTVCEERKHCDGDLGFLKWCAGLNYSLNIIDKYIADMGGK